MATLTLTNSNDKKTGTASDDKMDGLGGNDNLSGLNGNDTLLGGIGNDLLDGGVGNDSLLGGTGVDTLLGGSDHDSLKGDADNDRLDGGKGNDTLDGGTGNDTLIGGDGNDVYFVDNARDLITEVSGSLAGKDTVKSSIAYTLPLNVENLELTGLTDLAGTGNDEVNTVQGNGGNNLLDGKNGNDTLAGGEGDDTLTGGGGADSLVGGDGSDTYRVGSTEDKIVETARDGDEDVIESTVNYSLVSNVEVLTLIGPNALQGTGNELDNVLEGSEASNALNGDAGNDRIMGNDGADTLDGGEGNDTLEGGNGQDAVIYLGNQDDYKIFFDGDSGTWTVEDINGEDGDGVDEGTDQISDVGVLMFADGDRILAPGEERETVAEVAPLLSIQAITLQEGDADSSSATLTVSLSQAAKQAVTVNFSTRDGTATAGSDYTATASGVLRFAPGETRKTLSIPVVADIAYEADENFTVSLFNPQNAQLDANTSTATVTLTNDDAISVEIDADLTRLKSGDTRTLTFRFSDSPRGFDLEDVEVTGGVVDEFKADASGKIWTARLTPTPDVNEWNASLKVTAGSYTDAAGMAGTGSSLFTLSGDTGLPTLNISSDKTGLKRDEVATLTFAFDSMPTGFEADDVTVSGGLLGALTGTGLTRTALFTPTANSNDLNAVIGVASGRYTDESGNLNTESNRLGLSVDTESPTVLIRSDNTQLKAGDQANITFAFSEVPTGFGIEDIQVTGGIIDSLEADGKTYKAVFIPDENQAELAATLSIPAGAYTDSAGNSGAEGIPLALQGDTLSPGLTITSDKPVLKTGEVATLSFTFDDAPTGFDEDDIKVSGGSLGGLTGTGLTRTAVFTPTANKNDLNGVIRVPAGSYTDVSGNDNTASNVLSIAGDTASPGLTLSSSRTRFKAGDTAKVTFSFDETPTGFTADDITVAGGTLSGFAVNADNDKVYTALYTPNPIPAGVPKITTALKEYAYGGYGVTSKDYKLAAGGGTFTLKYNMYGIPDKAEIYVDSTLVTATKGFVSYTGTLTVNGTQLNKGSTVTVVLTGKDRGTAWEYDINYTKGVLDPADPTNKFTGAMTVAAGTYTDQAGNTGLAGNKLSFAGDLLAPGLEVDVSRASFRAGETADVTFKFEEAPVGFTLDDVKVTGGSLDNFSTTDTEGRIYTARLMPDAGINTLKGLLQVPAGSYADKLGNPGDAGNPVELSGDTLLPIPSGFTPLDNTSGIPVSNNLVLNFAEPVKAGTGDIIISNEKGDKRVVSVTDINQVIFDGNNVILDPKTNLQSGSSYNVQMAGGVIRDMAGNPYSGLVDSSAWNFSTAGSGGSPRSVLTVTHEPEVVLTGLARDMDGLSGL